MKCIAIVSRGMLFFSSILLLSACAGNSQIGKSSQGAERPVSQQSGGSSERQRAQIHTQLGGLYLQDGRYHVALEEAHIAISADSSYALAHNLLGLVHMYLKERNAAEEAFKKALDIAPKDPEIGNNYGWFLCNTQRESESFAWFELAYSNPLYQTPGKAYTNAAVCYMQTKQYPEAERFFLTALRYDGANTQAIYGLADIFYRTQRYVEARARLSDLERMAEPTSIVIWLALRMERAAGDKAAEQRYATQLRRKFQDSGEYQLMLKGQYD